MAKKKFYKKEKPQKISLLPHFYRTITEHGQKYLAWIRKKYIVILLIIELIVLLASVGATTYLFIEFQNSKREREEARNNLKKWEIIISSHKDNADAYYEAAVNALRLNDVQKANEYLDKAILLRDNFKIAKKLKSQIGQ